MHSIYKMGHKAGMKLVHDYATKPGAATPAAPMHDPELEEAHAIVTELKEGIAARWPDIKPEEFLRCTKCKKLLLPGKIRWLELSNLDGRYYWPSTEIPMPAEESQGLFPFGKDCASDTGLFWDYQGHNGKNREVYHASATNPIHGS